MNKEMVKKTEALSTYKEAEHRRDQIIGCKVYINQGKAVMGKLLEEGHLRRDWMALGYDTEDEWISDPHHIGMRPRTARSRRALWRFYEYCMRRFGINEKDLWIIDTSKLEAVAKRIKAEKNDKQAALIFESCKTNLLREILEEKEEEEYITVYARKCKVHRCLHEKSGQVADITISQIIWSPDISADNFLKEFGKRNDVEIRLRRKKDTDGQP